MKNTHTHHILPKHMGGTDDQSNLIELSVEEHAQAHKELYKKHGNWQDKMAYESLLKLKPRHEIAKELQRQGGLKSRGRTLKEEHKKKIGEWSKTFERTPESNQKRSKTLSKEWIITTPEGDKIRVVNLHKFCKENNLCSGNLSRNLVKNYTCQKA